MHSIIIVVFDYTSWFWCQACTELFNTLTV